MEIKHKGIRAGTCPGGETRREQIEFLSAVLIVSENPARLAAFYRDIVGIEWTRQVAADALSTLKVWDEIPA